MARLTGKWLAAHPSLVVNQPPPHCHKDLQAWPACGHTQCQAVAPLLQILAQHAALGGGHAGLPPPPHSLLPARQVEEEGLQPVRIVNQALDAV